MDDARATLELMGIFTAAAAVYLGVVALPTVALATRRRWPAVRAFVLALTLTLAFFAVGLGLFEMMILDLRPNGEDWERFAARAKLAFGVFYALVVTLGLALGFIFARGRSASPLWVAVAVATAIVTFLGLTFPLAEFLNACYIGDSLVLDAHC